MDKKKVLLIAQFGMNKGGVQTVIMSIIRNLSENYVFDLIVFSMDKRYYEEEIERYGGKVFRIPHRSSNDGVSGKVERYYRWFNDEQRIRSIIHDNGPYCAVHCNNEFESCIALRAAKKEGIPVRIAHAHVLRGQSTHKLRKIFDICQKKNMLKYGNSFIGCSEQACKLMFGESVKYTVIPNSFDETHFAPNKYPQFCPTNISMIQIGNFSALKNQLFTLQVFRSIVKQHPNAVLSYVGYDVGGYQTKLERSIYDLGLERNIHIYPYDANTPLLLSETSYLLLPSRTEAFGIVLVEAQAMGLTCFVSDIVPHSSNAGGCRYLSIQGDPEEWANAIMDDYNLTHGVHHQYDCTRFKSNEIAKLYDKMYAGKE